MADPLPTMTEDQWRAVQATIWPQDVAAKNALAVAETKCAEGNQALAVAQLAVAAAYATTAADTLNSDAARTWELMCAREKGGRDADVSKAMAQVRLWRNMTNPVKVT